MDRKSKSRIRLVNLRGASTEGKEAGEALVEQEIIDLGLGYRVMISEQAEVWTLAGYLKDGTTAKEEIGELSLVLVPGDREPATAITGYIAPPSPYVLAISEDALWQQLRNLVTQLGYDQDGYYLSLGIAGKRGYYENYRRE